MFSYLSAVGLEEDVGSVQEPERLQETEVRLEAERAEGRDEVRLPSILGHVRQVALGVVERQRDHRVVGAPRWEVALVRHPVDGD